MLGQLSAPTLFVHLTYNTNCMPADNTTPAKGRSTMDTVSLLREDLKDPQDLDRRLDLSGVGLGTSEPGSEAGHNVGWVLSREVVGHADNIAGEISCLKGLQGLQGYPF